MKPEDVFIRPEIDRLYKYRSFSQRSIEMLAKKQIWVSLPEEFNDPFDCQIETDLEISESEWESYLRTILELKEVPTNKICWYLEEFSKPNSEVRNMHLGAYQKHCQSLRDLSKEFGIYCLSESRDNILMWSHYASDHKGFCIEYRRTRDNFIGSSSNPVKYQDTYPLLRLLDAMAPPDATKNSVYIDLLFTKSSHWSYEKEWRLLATNPGVAKFNELDITGIIFGLRAADKDMEELRSALGGQKHIKYYRASKTPSRFSLTINEIT